MFDIQEELKKLPAKPGVYIMHDKTDEIIYVGKAISLKNRVRQYFQSGNRHSEKIRKMVSHIDHFEYIITDSEVEALVLECNLIKEHRPHYNTMLKDDKSYPYIKVTVSEDFPRVFSTHIMKRDKARYFGPYTSTIKETLELIRKLYRIRSCNRKLPEDIGKDRPCLQYQIGNCTGPCGGYIGKDEYRKNVDEVVSFLEGNYGPVKKLLTEEMQKYATELNFEEAARVRDLIGEVEKMSTRQKINNNDSQEDRDIIALARAEDEAVMQVFFVREGRLIGREHFYLTGVADEERGDIFSDFIKQYYSGTPFIPKELFVEETFEDMALLEEWLSERRGSKVSIKVPQRGEKAKLLDLAHKNAVMVLDRDSEKIKREQERTIGAMHEMEELLGLTGLRRTESFDISNTSGFEQVGSMVVYEDGKPKKNDYRRFKIKTVSGQDDYACMEEVLTRRFRHGIEEEQRLKEAGMNKDTGSFTRYPDILLMDGGKGQVNVALRVLENLGLNIPVAGLVKDDNHRTRGMYFNNEELPIDTRGELFKLITRIQDETHRFAIEYHKSLRGKAQIHSVLDDIPGVGDRRRRALMKAFISLDAIKAATVEELANVESMNIKSAEEVYNFFHK
ncbi:MAG: excinuclease ABC subunit UvrC [Lachnospiraceae bacterium]|nr:excinuclease ABC subunit UvrC [Lachnospiraceae bacterium]